MNTPKRSRKGATRRRHSAAFKRKLLDLSQQPGASVAAIALEHGINARANSPVLLPVALEVEELPASRAGAQGVAASRGVIEVELGQARLRLRGCVDEASLRCLVRALREAA